MDSGMLPEIEFLVNFNFCRFTRLPNSAGNSPTKLLLDKSMEMTLSLFNLTPYHLETGVFKSHLFFYWLPFVAMYNFIKASFSGNETLAKKGVEIITVKNSSVIFFLMIWEFGENKFW